MRYTFCAVAVLCWFPLCAVAQRAIADDNSILETLRSIDVTVARSDERDNWLTMVRDELARQRQRANAASSAEWHGIHDRVAWERFRPKKLAALRSSLGEWPTPLPPRVHIARTLDGEGFTIDNLVFESRPGWWVTANLYRPNPFRESQPGLLICHSHHTSKTHGELQDMGMTWARAGCLVLVMDQMGHGERRQHPFATAADFPQPFRLGHADYYFRYDSGLQLQLVGESLLGWMAWDQMRGVDVLLAQPGIDRTRLALLGAVAGGGDPAAVAGALDERLAAVVPFNFGGPQPETRFPLPDNSEEAFNYMGGGSWESTRNLRASAGEGYLPWVIVGGVAPRGLVYAHEFRWDRERDPVWRRLQTIYGFYDQPDRLAFTLGSGSVSGQSAEDSHCTHIGKTHRVLIHEAFRRWLKIDVPSEAEYSSRRPSEDLRCWTEPLRQQLQPKSLSAVLQGLADKRLGEARQRRGELSDKEHREQLRRDFIKLLGSVDPIASIAAEQRRSTEHAGVKIEQWVLSPTDGIHCPVVIAQPRAEAQRGPLVVAICSQGKSRLWRERTDEIAALVERGAVVCLVDPRGLGESRLGDSRGRRSAATSLASSRLMHEGTLLGDQVRDVRSVLKWLRERPDLRERPIAFWGESFRTANAVDARFAQPRDDDDALPPPSEPQGPLIALFAALFEDDAAALYTHGGLASWQSWLADYLVLAPYDSLVPGALTVADVSDIAASLAPCRVRLEANVDGWNRLAELPATRGAQLSQSVTRTSAATCLSSQAHP